ncbi:hypothetical protein JTB14_018128 [Gonioctena quinquepunctata]|nr:hypothetical protein JTB14_018128 [Gonioctena quinquepunctata]
MIPESLGTYEKFLQSNNSQYQQQVQETVVQTMNQCFDSPHTDAEQEGEDYKKIPVKSLIQTFEHNVMPCLKYKQIREPLPDVVEKLSPSRNLPKPIGESKTGDFITEGQIFRESKEMSTKMYQVANVEVKTMYFPPDQNRVDFQQSENSSFHKYVSPPVQSPSESNSHSFQSIESFGFANDHQVEGSNTLPRCKPKAPLSPNFKSNVNPPVFIPKESNTPLTSTYPPVNPQQGYEYEPVLQISSAQQSAKKLDLNSLQNYNTAPRGWGETKNFYKPITFSQPREVYSDF